MKRLTGAAWIVAPVVSAGLAFAITSAVHTSDKGLKTQANGPSDAPMVEWTHLVDLGEQELGTPAVGHVTVANRGSGELIIDQPTSSCTCAGLETMQGGVYHPLEKLKLAPGEAVELAARIQVKGLPGMKIYTVLSFRTNDPTNPQPTVNLVVPRVRGGFSAVPQTITFRPLPVGTEAVQVLDIRDGARQPRSVGRVECVSPGITARMLPESVKPESELHPAGVLVGRLEVKLRPAAVGSVNGEVFVYAAGEPTPSKIAVSGRGTSLVQATPAALVLPRASGGGPVYTSVCLCRSVEGKPMTLSLASAPEGISVEIPTDSGNSPRPIRITWDPVRGKALAGRGPSRVRLTADVGGRSEAVDLTVICQEGSSQ